MPGSYRIGDTFRPNVTKSSGLGLMNLFGAPRRDVAVRFIPADSAFERGSGRARLKTKFTRRARTVYKHHVLRNFHALDGNLRLPADQARKCRLCIGYTQREPMRDLQCGCRQTGYLRKRVQHSFQGQILGPEKIALADHSSFSHEKVARGALFDADEVQPG